MFPLILKMDQSQVVFVTYPQRRFLHYVRVVI